MNSSKEFFGQAANLIAKSFFPMILLAVISGITWHLVAEAGTFFGSTAKALFLELGAIALIAWKPRQWSWLNLVRGAVLVSAFCLVVIGAGFHSARPHLEDNGLNPADRLKLETLEASIEAHKRSVEAVAGQPRNSAIAARKLREAIDARDGFLATVEQDASVVAANRLAILTAISFRIVLQAINWLLVHVLVGLLTRPITKRREDRGMGQLIALPQSKQPLGENESKLYEWIRERGEATRAQIFQSKKLAGQEAYDAALDVLIRTGAVVCEAKGPMAGWKYRAVDTAAA